MTSSGEFKATSASDPERWLTALTLLLLALLQVALFALEGTDVGRVGAALIVIVSVWVSMTWRTGQGRAWLGVSVVALGAVANLVGDILRSSRPSPAPHLFAIALYGYASLVVAGAVSATRPRSRGAVILTCLSTWLMLLGGHALLNRVWPAALTAGGPAWLGGTVPHAVLGEYYAPNSVARTVYPTNPRGYFIEATPGELDWELVLHHEDSRARLNRSSDTRLRVEIDQAGVPTDWHIQLTRAGLEMQGSKIYDVSFRARADRAREISVGVSQAHAPWQGLGWYRTFDLGTDWNVYTDSFAASSTERDARVTFNLGAAAASVDLADVHVQRPGGASALVRRPPAYFVEYRFNSRGCRGPEYEVPLPVGQRRILALGDSFTLGVGVHAGDTFAGQLGAILNRSVGTQEVGPSYEVINCGVSGYATREARLMYALQAPHYRPNLVLLTMVHNDDRSWRSDAEQGYVHIPTAFERSFLPWAILQSARAERRRPSPDFTESIRELRALADDVRRDGGRLAVVVFRYLAGDGPLWAPLLGALSTGLRDSDVPWLDLGQTLPSGQRDEDRMVHAVDAHPNERAHRQAAESIAAFLREERLID